MEFVLKGIGVSAMAALGATALFLAVRIPPSAPAVEQTAGLRQASEPVEERVRFTPLAERYVSSKRCLMNITRGPDCTFWAAGYDGHDPERLYRSVDGADWDTVPVKTGGWILNDITFSDPETVWAVGGGGTVLRSSDGGQSWSKQPPPSRRDFDKIVFASPRVGYIGGQELRPDLMKYEGSCGPGYLFLLRTDDGGASWKVSYRSDDGPDTVFAIVPISESEALVSIGGNHLIRTDNGGRTWRRVGSAEMDPIGVTSLPDGTCWAVGRNGFFRSVDRGITWKREAANADFLVGPFWWSIDFVDAATAIAVGDRGACVLTTDGGETWTPVTNTPKLAYFNNDADHLRSVKMYGSSGIVEGSQYLYRVEVVPPRLQEDTPDRAARPPM